MSFASSQYQSPIYNNISATKNISATGNLNVSGTSNLNTTYINTANGQTSSALIINNSNPASSGSSTNSLTLTTGNYGVALTAQLTQDIGSSFSLGVGDQTEGFDTVMSGDQTTLTIASTLALNNGLKFNSNP